MISISLDVDIGCIFTVIQEGNFFGSHFYKLLNFGIVENPIPFLELPSFNPSPLPTDT
jgi:hypothetical protein